MNKLSLLEKLNNNKNWQKFCAGEDWFEPDFDYILKQIFKRKAVFHRKQWEFVVIFLSLYQTGKLNGNSHGVSFGAGKEPLLFDLLPFVGSLFATDLYSLSTGWNTAKLDSQQTPLEFVKSNAPNDVDLSNLNVAEMDMRDLTIDDDSIDFCYSSCAIEHIGERKDFIKHFQEVSRVLKSDGIYVVTTELLFKHETIKNKNNYKFDIEYLKQMFIEAGLDALPLFDASCEDSNLNRPRPFVRPLMGGNDINKIILPATILEYEGVPYTACNFILTPSKSVPKPFQVNGLKKSAELIKRRMFKNMHNLYRKKRAINPYFSIKNCNKIFCDDHMPFRVNVNSQIKLIDSKFSFTDFIWFCNKSVQFEIAFKIKGYSGAIDWLLVENNQLSSGKRKIINEKRIINPSKVGFQQLEFNFQAKPRKVYAIIGQVPKNIFRKNKPSMNIEYLDISVFCTN